MDSGRYEVYGVVPSDKEMMNAGLDPDMQQISGTIKIYATDDKDEAKKIYREGGFVRNGQWLACTWLKDAETGGTMGDVPEGV